MVVDVRKVLEAMRAKTQAIAAQVKTAPKTESVIVISFRAHLRPQYESIRIQRDAYRDCASYKRGCQKPLYKETRRGRGRFTTICFL